MDLESLAILFSHPEGRTKKRAQSKWEVRGRRRNSQETERKIAAEEEERLAGHVMGARELEGMQKDGAANYY